MIGPDLAPVLLFGYARPAHTLAALRALAANELASSTDVIAFLDGARGEQDAAAVGEVRAIVRSFVGFRSLEVVERAANLGLAENITQGVTQMLTSHDFVIVLEDDIVTAPGFLVFMNEAAQKYRNDERVWHVGAWVPEIHYTGDRDAEFLRVMNCWGWGTWASRWKFFERNPGRLLKEWDQSRIDYLNLDKGHDYWSQVIQNGEGRLKTWAVFWYTTIVEHGGLCINASESLTENVGLDGSGENCLPGAAPASTLSSRRLFRWPDEVAESYPTLVAIREAFMAQQRWHHRARRALRKVQGSHQR